MKTIEEIYQLLKTEFNDDVKELKQLPVDPFIEINPLKTDLICKFLKDNIETDFDYMLCVSGVDEADGNKVKDAEGNTLIEGGNLAVYYHLASISKTHKLTLKALCPRNNPIVKSVTEIWKTADWQEREIYDLLGIVFENHPNLERILMPYDWEGYPLRKDYKNLEFYHGIKIAAE